MANIGLEVVIGIVGAAGGGALLVIAQWLVHRAREARGLFTGEWEQRIFDPGPEPSKIDRVICRQTDERVEGTIQRESPSDQRHRKWHFRGRYRGQLFFGHFWSAHPEDPSYGTLQLRQVGQGIFKGFYVRLEGIADRDGVVTKFGEELRTIPFEWEKMA